MIRDSARFSRSLAGVSAEVERLFWRLILCADDFGRTYGDPVTMRSLAYPVMADQMTVQQIAGWRDELVKAGCLRLYQVDGRLYCYFPAWFEHQQMTRAKHSKFPAPPPIAVEHPSDSQPIAIGQLSDSQGETRDVDVDVDVDVRRETKTAKRSRKALAVPDGFAEFWDIYPWKVGKGDAEKAWSQVLRDTKTTGAEIVQGLRRNLEPLSRQQPGYRKHPGAWLRAKRWLDEPSVNGPALFSSKTAGNVASLQAAMDEIKARQAQ